MPPTTHESPQVLVRHKNTLTKIKMKMKIELLKAAFNMW